MKKISWLVVLMILVVLPGCFDTLDETTINDNGSGMFVHKDDMGKLFSMVKMFAGDNEKMKDLGNVKKDSTVYLKDIKDSIKNLTAAEMKILAAGTLKIDIDAEKENLSFTFSFPFSKPNDISQINQVLKKTKQQILDGVMKKTLAQSQPEEQKNLFGKELSNDDMESSTASVNDYYITEFQKGKLSCRVNKEKITGLENDKGMSSLKELSSMGLSSNIKTIINLPAPAKKATGKGLKLSDDRKQITIEGTLDDFFESASFFEYEIEY